MFALSLIRSACLVSLFFGLILSEKVEEKEAPDAPVNSSLTERTARRGFVAYPTYVELNQPKGYKFPISKERDAEEETTSIPIVDDNSPDDDRSGWKFFLGVPSPVAISNSFGDDSQFRPNSEYPIPGYAVPNNYKGYKWSEYPSGFPAPINDDSNKPRNPVNYKFPPHSENAAAKSWDMEKMKMMMDVMKSMKCKEVAEEGKANQGGLLSALVSDPMVFLVTAIIPLILFLSTLAPLFFNGSNGNDVTLQTTTANGRRLEQQVDLLTPVMEAFNKYEAISLKDPQCVQRILCEITKGSSRSGDETRVLQNFLYKASTLVDGSWLERFGVKSLVKALKDGECELVPCQASSSIKKKSEN